jgi:hypothetical protein
MSYLGQDRPFKTVDANVLFRRKQSFSTAEAQCLGFAMSGHRTNGQPCSEQDRANALRRPTIDLAIGHRKLHADSQSE